MIGVPVGTNSERHAAPFLSVVVSGCCAVCEIGGRSRHDVAPAWAVGGGLPLHLGHQGGEQPLDLVAVPLIDQIQFFVELV